MNDRVLLVKMLGGKCILCDVSDVEMLHLDHIRDDGGSDRARFGGNISMLYTYYLANIDMARETFEVLCANHHRKKTAAKRKAADLSSNAFRELRREFRDGLRASLQYILVLNAEDHDRLRLMVERGERPEWLWKIRSERSIVYQYPTCPRIFDIEYKARLHSKNCQVPGIPN